LRVGTLVCTKACRTGAAIYTIHFIPVSKISAMAPDVHLFSYFLFLSFVFTYVFL